MTQALITGIGGQDGSLLAELLVERGCEVFGIIKREAIAIGKLHSVREFADIAFKKVGLELDRYLKINTKFFRTSEHKPLCGNADKLRSLGWKPSNTLDEMINDEMIIQSNY